MSDTRTVIGIGEEDNYGKRKNAQYYQCSYICSHHGSAVAVYVPHRTGSHYFAEFCLRPGRRCAGKEMGAISIGVWLLLGLLGIPILTMGKAGAGIFFSPVGGYYLGFVVMAWVSGFRLAEKGHFLRQVSSAVLGLICCYALGTVWFMGYFHFGLGKEMPLWTALTLTVFPFVAFDLIKVILGVICGTRIRQSLNQAGYYPTMEH